MAQNLPLLCHIMATNNDRALSLTSLVASTCIVFGSLACGDFQDTSAINRVHHEPGLGDFIVSCYSWFTGEGSAKKNANLAAGKACLDRCRDYGCERNVFNNGICHCAKCPKQESLKCNRACIAENYNYGRFDPGAKHKCLCYGKIDQRRCKDFCTFQGFAFVFDEAKNPKCQCTDKLEKSGSNASGPGALEVLVRSIGQELRCVRRIRGARR